MVDVEDLRVFGSFSPSCYDQGCILFHLVRLFMQMVLDQSRLAFVWDLLTSQGVLPETSRSAEPSTLLRRLRRLFRRRVEALPSWPRQSPGKSATSRRGRHSFGVGFHHSPQPHSTVRDKCRILPSTRAIDITHLKPAMEELMRIHRFSMDSSHPLKSTAPLWPRVWQATSARPYWDIS